MPLMTENHTEEHVRLRIRHIFEANSESWSVQRLDLYTFMTYFLKVPYACFNLGFNALLKFFCVCVCISSPPFACLLVLLARKYVFGQEHTRPHKKDLFTWNSYSCGIVHCKQNKWKQIQFNKRRAISGATSIGKRDHRPKDAIPAYSQSKFMSPGWRLLCWCWEWIEASQSPGNEAAL